MFCKAVPPRASNRRPTSTPQSRTIVQPPATRTGNVMAAISQNMNILSSVVTSTQLVPGWQRPRDSWPAAAGTNSAIHSGRREVMGWGPSRVPQIATPTATIAAATCASNRLLYFFLFLLDDIVRRQNHQPQAQSFRAAEKRGREAIKTYSSSSLGALPRFQALTTQLWVASTYFSFWTCLTPTRTPSFVKTTFFLPMRSEAVSRILVAET